MNQSDKPSLQTSEEAIAASVPSSSKSPPSSSSSSSLWWPKRIHHSLSQHSSATTSNKSDNKGNSNSNNNNNNNTNDTNSSSMSITGDESESTQEFTLTNGRDNGNTISTCTFSSTGGRRRSAGENHLSSSSSFRDALVNSSNGDSFHSGIMRLDDIAKEKRKSQIKPAQYFETKQRIQEMLPISNLRFSSLGLIGREKETACLEACLERVTVPTAVRRSKDEPSMSTSKDEEESRVRRELVLISGDSGTGKTTLAETLLNPVTQRVGGLFVKGKFDIYRRNEPYSGIAGACREICGRIMSLLKRESCRSDDHNKRSECESNSWIQFQTILEVLVSKLGMENIRLLIHIIPELSEIVGEKLLVVAENVDVLNNNDATAGNGARLNYAFRIFMQVVANRLGPLVIFLDDIQWADTASIELLPVLLTGSDISNFMIIGAYRSNEVKDDDDHPFSKLITEMKLNNTDSATNNHEFNLTEIKLGNLTELQTNEMIMKVLSIDEPDTTIGLAKVCHKRSHGNIFSLLVFLDMLQMEGLLQYNLGLFRWDWDEQTILSQSAATANVVDVLTQKMKLLPSSARLGLSVAACLGYCFKPSILDTVLRALFANRCLNNSSTPLQTTADPSDESLQDPDETLEMLILGEREGFLEIENDGLTYRWIHDKVQEAAMSLVPLDDLPKLKAQVGSALVHELREEELAPYLFTVVNLLHEQGIPKIEVERVQLANLALQASKRASEASAFESAAKYVAIGLEALPTNAWANYYELTLDLYSTAAETASILGQKEDLEKYYAEVLSRTSSRLVDKFRVYHSMINFLSGALGKPLEAMKIIILILAQLGVSFPKHKIPRLMGTVSRFWALKKALSSVRREHIESLPTMKDSRQLEIMRLLDKLFLAAYLGKSDLIVMSVLASTRMTLENGLSEYSAPAFAELALLAGSAFGDVPLATKTGDFAQVVTAKVESKVMDCRTELFLCGFTRCWTDFIARMMPRLVHAYEVGLSVGDNENACWCIAQFIVIGFQCGTKSLESVKEDCLVYKKQMAEFNRETCHADICIYTEMIQNLADVSTKDPTKFKNDKLFRSHIDHTVLGVYYSCQCLLYMYFGEYTKGAELAIQRGDAYAIGVPGHVWTMIETFVRGMCLYVASQTSRKRKYVKEAKKVHRLIKSWIKKGNPNVKHYDLLLEAENATLKGNLEEAERNYQSSILCATHQGHIHESALASERYGYFVLNERKDKEEARHKFDEAIRRYDEWGAKNKANVLREIHSDLWHPPEQIF